MISVCFGVFRAQIFETITHLYDYLTWHGTLTLWTNDDEFFIKATKISQTTQALDDEWWDDETQPQVETTAWIPQTMKSK